MINKPKLFNELGGYNWQCALGHMEIKLRDILEVYAIWDGQVGLASWCIFAKLNNGKYVRGLAWCDHKGWDGCAKGKSELFVSEDAFAENLQKTLNAFLPRGDSNV